jgi:hypothetical protein
MSKLDMIVAQRRIDVAEAKARIPAEELCARIAAAKPPADFVQVLKRNGPMALLGEMKRASPSKGDIARGVDAAQQGLAYALAGACTISVLTEPHWFKGSLDDLARVRWALESGGLSPDVCVLRKDFIIDEYQLLEARAHGADTALLIVASLPMQELTALMVRVSVALYAPRGGRRLRLRRTKAPPHHGRLLSQTLVLCGPTPAACPSETTSSHSHAIHSPFTPRQCQTPIVNPSLLPQSSLFVLPCKPNPHSFHPPRPSPYARPSRGGWAWSLSWRPPTRPRCAPRSTPAPA